MEVDDKLHLLEQTLEWRHLAPTAPDQLAAYPFGDEDPLIFGKCPHVYFVGNQKDYQTKLLEGKVTQKLIWKDRKDKKCVWCFYHLLVNPKRSCWSIWIRWTFTRWSSRPIFKVVIHKIIRGEFSCPRGVVVLGELVRTCPTSSSLSIWAHVSVSGIVPRRFSLEDQWSTWRLRASQREKNLM